VVVDEVFMDVGKEAIFIQKCKNPTSIAGLLRICHIAVAFDVTGR
jgi:hypothetical protein